MEAETIGLAVLMKVPRRDKKKIKMRHRIVKQDIPNDGIALHSTILGVNQTWHLVKKRDIFRESLSVI